MRERQTNLPTKLFKITLEAISNSGANKFMERTQCEKIK